MAVADQAPSGVRDGGPIDWSDLVLDGAATADRSGARRSQEGSVIR